jgi:hypothetical protein
VLERCSDDLKLCEEAAGPTPASPGIGNLTPYSLELHIVADTCPSQPEPPAGLTCPPPLFFPLFCPPGFQALPQAAHLFPAEPFAGLRTVGEVVFIDK